MAHVIVVADDDPDVAGAIEVNLSLEGYEVHVVSDGVEALDAAFTLEPDLIVLDWLMPRKDGLEVCRELRSDPRTADVPVVLLTAKSQADDKVEGLTSGADDYIVKPFEPSELVARVAGLLRRSSQMRDLSPLTRLPGNFRIAAELEALVKDPENRFAVLYADLNDFKSFNDHYGFLRGDEVIKFTARVITETLSAHPSTPQFAGHVGGDDFVIIVSPEVAVDVAEGIIERFDAGIGRLYDAEDAARGSIDVVSRQGERTAHALVGIAIGIVSTDTRALATQWEASALATEMKAHAKRHPRSAYEIDRRGA
ncbi:MAG: response regulator [Acidimicrobiia bacterium]